MEWLTQKREILFVLNVVKDSEVKAKWNYMQLDVTIQILDQEFLVKNVENYFEFKLI